MRKGAELKSKRMVIVAFALLIAVAPSRIALAADGPAVGTGDATAKAPLKGEAMKPAKDEPALPQPASPLAEELEELRETVQAQAQRLAEHTQELESERAALQDELDRIARLETEMHAAPGGLAPGDAVASAAVGATTVQDSAAASRTLVPPQGGGSRALLPQQQNPPTQGSVDRRLADLEKRLQRIVPLSFSGDFRLREDAFFGGPADHSLDQNAQNYRLRFNVDTQLSDDLSGGFSLASGNLNDPTSTNQTINGFYARKPFSLDKAFVRYNPGFFKPLTLVGGKFTYPWYNTELTWDKDINPEGAAETLAFDLKSTPVLKRIALVAFELPFSQVAGVSLQNKSLLQTATYGGQFQTAWRLTGRATLSTYLGFYDFRNADPMALALAKASSKNPATPLVGLLPLAGGGGAVQNSVTTTDAAGIVTVNGTIASTGVTTVTNSQFASKFGLFDSIVRFDVATSSPRWPISIIGDYVQNTEACANVKNILPPPANTATAQFSQTTNFPCNPNQKTGYWAEAEVGRILEKHDLQFGYTRIFIEREAVLSNFNYNQMYQGSNVTEHRFSVFYTARQNVILDFIALVGRPLNDGNPNPQPNFLDRLQFDVNYVF